MWQGLSTIHFFRLGLLLSLFTTNLGRQALLPSRLLSLLLWVGFVVWGGVIEPLIQWKRRNGRHDTNRGRFILPEGIESRIWLGVCEDAVSVWGACVLNVVRFPRDHHHTDRAPLLPAGSQFFRREGPAEEVSV